MRRIRRGLVCGLVVASIAALPTSLVTRAANAVRTWTGAGADNNWRTAANWLGGVAPAAGDDLVFPSSAKEQTNNDYPDGTVFGSIAAQPDNYVFRGNTVSLSAGLSGTMTMDYGSYTGSGHVALRLTADQTFNCTDCTLRTIDNNGHTLTIDGTGSTTGAMTGSGGLIKIGTGTFTTEFATTGTSNYGGATDIRDGTMIVPNGGFIQSAGRLTIAPDAKVSIVDSFAGFGSIADGPLGSGSVEVPTGYGTLGVGSDNSTTTFGGHIDKGEVWKTGSGALTLTGSNSQYSDRVTGGQLKVGSSGAIAAHSVLHVLAGAFVLNGFDITVGALDDFGPPSVGQASGSVLLGRNTLTITACCNQFGGPVYGYYSGVISGTGGLVMKGTANEGFFGPNSYTGSTIVEDTANVYSLNHVGPTDVTVGPNAYFAGQGSIAGLVTEGTSILWNLSASRVYVAVGQTTFNGVVAKKVRFASGSTVRFSLPPFGNGWTVFLTSKTPVDLRTAPSLVLDKCQACGFTTTTGETLTLISAPHIKGTFKGLPDGSRVVQQIPFGGSGRTYVIHYTPNKVTITDVS
jgi:hypothetical protein